MNKLGLEKLLQWAATALLAYMPFHLFLSRWLSLYTGGLGVWEAAKDIATVIAVVLALYVFARRKLYTQKWLTAIVGGSALYLMLHLAYLLVYRDLFLPKALIATVYNGRLFAYLFIGTVAAKVSDGRTANVAVKVIFYTSALTALFAVAQYVLPKDLMTHFGYSFARGVKPAFFIDDKPGFPRVMSTVRDPNSYGAYLILPLALAGVYVRQKQQKLLYAGILGLLGLAMFLTFSRGAWFGAAITLAVGLYLIHRQVLQALLKKYITPFLLGAVLLIAFITVFRNNYVFQNLLLHKDRSTVATDPNNLRVQLQGLAVRETLRRPEGHGPGTAGIVSIGNPRGTFLTENYYLQLGYEVGLAGLGLYLAMLALIYHRLTKLNDWPVRTALLATFWGYAFIGLLIHLWSNEAVAAQWWLLAGMALGAPATGLSPLRPRAPTAVVARVRRTV